MKRLSIIVPMYKVESYVERCIHSLEEQDIPENDFEIICINDGSPDNSSSIVTQMQKIYNNIILINQENQGVSRARNNGIERASGKYLLFIDPDDYVEASSYGRILKNADEKNVQVSFLGFKFLNEDESERRRICYGDYSIEIYPGTDAYFLARGDGKTDPDRMWAILFLKDFINHHKLLFLPDVPYLEDGELIARILCLAERCIFDKQTIYNRTTRVGSATNSKLFQSHKAMAGFLLAATNIKQFQNGRDLNKPQKEFLNRPILKFLVLAVNSTLGGNFNSKIRYIRKYIYEHDLKKCNLQGVDSFYRYYGKAYNLSLIYLGIVLVLRPRLRKLREKYK